MHVVVARVLPTLCEPYWNQTPKSRAGIGGTVDIKRVKRVGHCEVSEEGNWPCHNGHMGVCMMSASVVMP
jgi:hypothetical protein